jgi:hypothetical protein
LFLLAFAFQTNQANAATNVDVTLISPENQSKCVKFVENVIEFTWEIENPDAETIDSLVLNIYDGVTIGAIWSKKLNSDEISLIFDSETESVDLKYFTSYSWNLDAFVGDSKAF